MENEQFENKRLFKNTLILGVGMVLPKLINLLTIPLYSYYVDVSEFGTLSYLTTLILSLIVPIITLQLENATFRYLIDTTEIKTQKEYISTAFFMITLMAIPTMIIMYFVPLGSFTEWYYHLIVSIYVGVQTYVLFFRQTTRGFGRNAVYATSSVVSVVCNFLLMVLFMAVMNLGALGYFLSLMLADVFSIIYLLFKNNFLKYISIKSVKQDVLGKMLRYSLPLIPNTVSWFCINFFDQTIVTFMLGSAANGILSTAHKIPNMFNTIYSAFNLAWTEDASRNSTKQGLSQYYTRMFNAMFKMLSGGAMLLIAVSPIVFTVLVRSQSYYDALNYMPLLIVATYLSCFASFLGSIYVACKASRSVGISSIGSAIINIIIHLVLIDKIGIQAAGVSSVCAFLSLTIYRAIDINKHFYHIHYNKRLIFFVVICFVITIGLYYTSNIALQVVGIVFAAFITYFLNEDLLKSLWNRFVVARRS